MVSAFHPSDIPLCPRRPTKGSNAEPFFNPDEIEALAKRRLADEYDAAQERGEVGKQGQRTDLIPNEKKVPTAADIGLTGKDIHEARQITQPG